MSVIVDKYSWSLSITLPETGHVKSNNDMNTTFSGGKKGFMIIKAGAMADSSPLQSTDEHELLQSALQSPFQPADVPLQSTVPPAPPPPTSTDPITAESSSQPQPPEGDPWKAEYDAQVEEWRAQSAEARAKAERERAKWESIRLREAEQRRALGQESEPWDSLGSHITETSLRATIPLAPTRFSASYLRTYPAPPESLGDIQHNDRPPFHAPLYNGRQVAPRTRVSLILTSLAINLLLPFVNGVMLGFGEIFAKDILVGWIGWKRQSGRTAANVGLWR
ncbi:hypothetical protein BU15DRAFT_63791 [Melanogaster broomeanus]|nr:hypothetical protein BU15DRAFT_63791 [Melanogaster broomeanus]